MSKMALAEMKMSALFAALNPCCMVFEFCEFVSQLVFVYKY